MITPEQQLAAFNTLNRVLNNELGMRKRVFPEGDPKRAAKLREIGDALTALRTLGEALNLKEWKQPTLFDG